MNMRLCNTVILGLTCSGFAAASPIASDSEYCFEQHVIDGSGSGADGVHAGDINGDGYADVVSGWEESAALRLYLHPGETIGDKPQNWKIITISDGPSVSAIEDAAFLDLDDNGAIDSVLSATEGEGGDSNRRIRLHRVSLDSTARSLDGAWQTSVIHSDRPTERFMKVRGAQIDKQNGADIVAISRDLFENPDKPEQITTPGGVFLYTAPHTDDIHKPTAWQRQRLADVHKGKSIELLDMDADNDLDILYSGARNVVWLENPLLDSTGSTWKSHWIGTGSDLALCDINGDGAQDIVATASQKEYPIIARWFEGRNGKVKRRRVWTSHEIRLAEELPSKFYQPQRSAIKSIACASLDTAAADAPASIFITTSGTGFGVFLAVAPPDFSSNYTSPWRGIAVSDYRYITKYDNIIATDLDKDGDIDLVTSEENEGLMLRGAGVLWYEGKPCH